MPTLDGNHDAHEPEVGLMATHLGGKTPLSERFRRASLRAKMFGDAGESLTVSRYRITGRVGEGAMGTVFRATDDSLDRDVAVKVLHRTDETHRARLNIEAKALARLSHPNVVTVHEVGVEDEQFFVAMEYVAGQTLERWLRDPQGPSVLDVFLQAAAGLQAAHDAGVVHRDFKPDNVLVGDDGRVRVVDFGMAHTPGTPLTDEIETGLEAMQPTAPAITRTGVLAGTPSYMAPEQFLGARVNAAADQFAFCVALHEAVWGYRPFDGDDVATLSRNVLEGRSRLFEGQPRSTVTGEQLERVRVVVERGLRQEPNQRFGSMNRLADALRPPLVPAVAPKRKRWAVAAAGIGVAMGALLLMPPSEEPNPEPQAVVEAIAPSPTSQRTSTSIDQDIARIACADDTCSVPWSLVRAPDGQPLQLDLQARVVPMQRNDELVGYKLYGIRTDSLLDALGFENGDAVVGLNDIPVTDKENLMKLAGTLTSKEAKAPPTLVVEYRRKDAERTLDIEFVE